MVLQKDLKICTGTGVLDHINKENKKTKYFNASRYIIIGPGFAGKTVLATNLAIYAVEHYNNLIMITPTLDDPNLLALSKWANKAGMNVLYTSVDPDDGTLNIPDNITKALFIIDDYYSQRNQPLVIKKLINNLFIRGRHDFNSIIYIAHSDRNLPHEIKACCTGLFIDRPYDNIPLSETIPTPDPDNNQHIFYQLNSYEQPTKCDPVAFKPMKHIGEIVEKLEYRTYLEDRNQRKKLGETYKLSGLDMNKLSIAEGEEKAGNKAGKESKEKTIKLNKKGVIDGNKKITMTFTTGNSMWD